MKSTLLAVLLAVVAVPAFAADEAKAKHEHEHAHEAKLNTVCPLDGKACDGKTTVEIGEKEKKVAVAVCCKDCAEAVKKAKAHDVIAAVKANKKMEKASEKAEKAQDKAAEKAAKAQDKAAEKAAKAQDKAAEKAAKASEKADKALSGQQ